MVPTYQLMGKSAVVAGGSGLVGSFLLRELLSDPAYSKVVALVRRGLPLAHRKLEQISVDFDALPALPKVDEAFCCLGTTRAKAGSAVAFRKIDLDAVAAFARAAGAAGAKQFFLVSSSGANKNSWFLYPRTKGQAERAVAGLAYVGVHVFRPSLLLGERAERRRGERLAQVLLGPFQPLFVGPLRRFAPIAAETVARALVRRAAAAPPGFHVLENERIFSEASEAKAPDEFASLGPMTAKSPITTHVLDTARGLPAMGVPARLEHRVAPDAWKLIGKGTTDHDGRVGDFLPQDWPLENGVYRLTFDTGAYFKSLGSKSFYPVVAVTFEVVDKRHHHVPLLLSPFGYSTYRGS